jgi:very-short-patch-repair endonuclease
VRLPDGRRRFVDLAYPDALLAVEADGYTHHATLGEWSRDHVRSNELVALGWRILPVTYRDLQLRPAAVADQVRRALAAGEVRRVFPVER